MLAPLSSATLHHFWGTYQPWSNAGVFPTSTAVAPHNTATAATTLQVMRCLILALAFRVGNSPVGTGQSSIKENNLQLTTFQWEDGEAAHIGATVSFQLCDCDGGSTGRLSTSRGFDVIAVYCGNVAPFIVSAELEYEAGCWRNWMDTLPSLIGYPQHFNNSPLNLALIFMCAPMRGIHSCDLWKCTIASWSTNKWLDINQLMSSYHRVAKKREV